MSKTKKSKNKKQKLATANVKKEAPRQSRRREQTLRWDTKYYCPDLNNGYQILSGHNGLILAGHYFELTLEDVRDYLNDMDNGIEQ